MDTSFAIPVCNEAHELRGLLGQLVGTIPSTDEIVVLCDEGNTTPEVKEVLGDFTDHLSVYEHPLRDDFAAQKNYLTSKCTKDWVFLIDADETLSTYLLENVSAVLDMNTGVDAIAVPRVNTVTGLTMEDAVRWQWELNERKWINWPDYQWRLYKNDPRIKWKGQVHERLVGFGSWATLPADKDFALFHKKDIERQRRQNDHYDTLERGAEGGLRGLWSRWWLH
jgi:glycosyltransferase involved in cell wall biosynthesis